jgi:hypothetical protein
MEAVLVILGLIALIGLVLWAYRFSKRWFEPGKEWPPSDPERRLAERTWLLPKE